MDTTLTYAPLYCKIINLQVILASSEDCSIFFPTADTLLSSQNFFLSLLRASSSIPKFHLISVLLVSLKNSH